MLQCKYIFNTKQIQLWYSANTMVERWSLGQALPPHMQSSEKSCGVWEVSFPRSTQLHGAMKYKYKYTVEDKYRVCTGVDP